MAERLGAKIAVIGGGTGSFTVLSGLKHYAKGITALVNMADDGGSTGLLRDELGALPPGDVRQCLVALSESPKVRDLFNYRFEDGSLKGHAFGNLFLTALEKMTGNFAEGVELAGEVLKISGTVEPVTLSDVRLCAAGRDDSIVAGQYNVENADFGSMRPKLWLEPEATLNPEAAIAVCKADIIVIAPGNLYASLAPALLIPELQEALNQTKGKKVYVSNLVTKPGHTDGFAVSDYASEIERIIGRPVLDYVLYNTSLPSDELLQKYAREGEYAVKVDKEVLSSAHYKAVGADLLSPTVWQSSSKGDMIQRTYIRHDSDKVARQLMKIYFS